MNIRAETRNQRNVIDSMMDLSLHHGIGGHSEYGGQSREGLQRAVARPGSDDGWWPV